MFSLIASGMSLSFGFRRKADVNYTLIFLVVKSVWVSSAVWSQGRFSFLRFWYCPANKGAWGHKLLGGDRTGIADLNWPKGCSIQSDIMWKKTIKLRGVGWGNVLCSETGWASAGWLVSGKQLFCASLACVCVCVYTHREVTIIRYMYTHTKITIIIYHYYFSLTFLS